MSDERAARAVLDAYDRRLEEIRATMVGAPRPDILTALCDAAAAVGPCVPVKLFETWAREISEGRSPQP